MYFSALNEFKHSFDWNPVFIELIWFAIFKYSGNMGLFFLIFSVLSLLSLIIIFYNASKDKWYKNFFAFALFCISPLYFLYSAHLYKDIPFTAMILLTIAIIKIQENKVSFYSWIPLILACLIRHNGFILAIFIIFYQSWLIKRDILKSLLNCVLFLILFSSTKFIIVNKTLHKPQVSGAAVLLPMFDISGIIARREKPLPNKHFLNSKTSEPLDHATYKRLYMPNDVEPFLYDTSNIVEIHTETETSNFFIFWLKTILTNPKEYIHHRIIFFKYFITMNHNNGRSMDKASLHNITRNKSFLHKKILSPILDFYNKSSLLEHNIEYLLIYILASLLCVLLSFLKKINLPNYIKILNLSGLFYTFSYLAIGSSPAFKYTLFHPWSALIVYLYIIFASRWDFKKLYRSLLRIKSVLLIITFNISCAKNYSATFQEYQFCMNPEVPSEHYVGLPYIDTCLKLLEFIPEHSEYENQLKVLCQNHNNINACKLSNTKFSKKMYLNEVVLKQCFSNNNFTESKCHFLKDAIDKNIQLKIFKPFLDELIKKSSETNTKPQDYHELKCKYFKELRTCST